MNNSLLHGYDQSKVEILLQIVTCSHLQIAVWKCLLNADPATVDIQLYGWGKVGETKYLIPLTVSPDVYLVPEDTMTVFKCCYALENQ